MKCLYLGVQGSEKNSGGNVIKKRNVDFLKENYSQFDVHIFNKVKGLKKRVLFSLTNRLLCITEYKNSKVKEYLAKTNYDLIFIDSSQIGFVSKALLKKNNFAVFFHNVEYDYYLDYGKKYKGLKQIASRPFINAIKKNEKRLCKYAKTLITLNERDSERLNCLYNRKADVLWPTSFKDSYNADKEVNIQERYLLFVGMNFFGNTDGLFWFIENCMDSINYRLIIAGGGMDKYKDKYANKNIEFLGFVEDLEALYVNASAVVLPIISGSGMKTKTCEALMYGKKIFGTDEAFIGYNNIDNTSCVRCNSKSEFIDKINNFIQSDEKDTRYYNDIREYYLNNFEESKINKDFKEYFVKKGFI